MRGGWLRTVVLGGVLTASAVRGLAQAVTSLRTSQPANQRSELRGGARWRRRAITAAVVLAALGVGGGLLAVSGVVPIKASSGHWAITRWFLQFSKQRSVATHSLAVAAPPLDAPWLVLKGAGHYETGCRPCHGSPAVPSPRIAQAMTPRPPYLPRTVARWDRDELFYIVKHGIKFTGMPAWPSALRDDEVWAMVAFLRRLPEMDVAEYQRLANGDVGDAGPAASLQEPVAPGRLAPALLASCGRCHGVDGLGRGLGAFPKLAGQRPLYLDLSLQAFARGERHSGVMEPIAAALSAGEMRDLAAYYGRLGAPPSSGPDATAAVARGRTIAERGIQRQRVPSCVPCHGPVEAPRSPAYPELAGQYADYLVLQLTLFQRGARGGTAYAHVMQRAAAGLTADQIDDVAAYYASLEPTRADRRLGRLEAPGR